MSAIFGIVSKQGKPVEQAGVEAMKNILQHRAIDGRGYYQTPQAFFGHHKHISNIHQKNERQPIEDDQYLIVADARIDNRDELIKLLEVKLPDVSDAYLILRAYYKWKQDCPKHLEGEFTFVILNKGDNTIFSATDHIGVRSFYYYDCADFFVFSSELKGIAVLEFVPKAYEQKILIQRFTLNQTDITPYKHIHILLGGRILYLDSEKKLHNLKYWNLEPTGKYKFNKDEDWADCLRDLMFDLIRNAINTDKPVGVQLSGGLDSSFVAAIASKILKEKNKQLVTVSSVLPPGYNGIGTDERFYINTLCNFLGNVEQHLVSLPEGVGLFTDITKTLAETEDFGANGSQVIQRYIFETAQMQGVNVFLTGLGGDMTISNKGKQVVFEKIKKAHLATALKLIGQKRKNGTTLKRVVIDDIINNIIDVKKARDKGLKRASFLNADLAELIDSDTMPVFSTTKDHFIYTVNNGQFGRSLQLIQNSASYFCLNYSHPIYCKKIVDFFADLPPEQLILNGVERSLIRRAMIGLAPPEIYNRRNKEKFLPDFEDRFNIGLETMKGLLVSDGSVLKRAGIKVDDLIAVIGDVSGGKESIYATKNKYKMMSLFFLYFCYSYFFENTEI